MSQSNVDAEQPARRPLRTLLPLAIFAGLAIMFFVGLFSGDPSKLPSALIGKPIPEFELPALKGLTENGKPVPGFSTKDLAGDKITVVNVWASWCIPCHQELPFLGVLAKKSGAELYGLNYKDGAASARRFLGRYGNPFAAVGQDNNGRVAINWGVYGVPETFIVSDGKIVYKHVGPIDDKIIDERLMPAIKKARGES